jgi:hypothetical protein
MALAWTLPSSFLLVNAWQGNAEGPRLWRYISFGVDAASFAALIGLAWISTDNHTPKPSDGFVFTFSDRSSD